MEFSPGAIALDNIIGGTLQVGSVPLPRTIRAEYSAKSSGVITITGVFTYIISLPIINALVGDRILFFVLLEIGKELTAGQTDVRVIQAGGSGTIVFGHDNGFCDNNMHLHQPSTPWLCAWAGIAKVTVAGTITLALLAASEGSDGNVNDGRGQLVSWLIPGG